MMEPYTTEQLAELGVSVLSQGDQKWMVTVHHLQHRINELNAMNERQSDRIKRMRGPANQTVFDIEQKLAREVSKTERLSRIVNEQVLDLSILRDDLAGLRGVTEDRDLWKSRANVALREVRAFKASVKALSAKGKSLLALYKVAMRVRQSWTGDVRTVFGTYVPDVSRQAMVGLIEALGEVRRCGK